MDNERLNTSEPRNLIIGIGNDFRGDDGVGIGIVSKLRERGIAGYEIFEYSGEGTRLVSLWKGADKVIVIDAAFSGAEAGKIYRFEIGKDIIPSKLFAGYSTHAIGLAEAIELSKTLDSFPRKLIIYGIEGKSYETGGEISAAVSESAEIVIARIIKEIA